MGVEQELAPTTQPRAHTAQKAGSYVSRRGRRREGFGHSNKSLVVGGLCPSFPWRPSRGPRQAEQRQSSTAVSDMASRQRQISASAAVNFRTPKSGTALAADIVLARRAGAAKAAALRRASHRQMRVHRVSRQRLPSGRRPFKGLLVASLDVRPTSRTNTERRMGRLPVRGAAAVRPRCMTNPSTAEMGKWAKRAGQGR